MNENEIDASPTKELFLDTLVKDVSIIDAVLDLVDNSIDGYLRQEYSERKKINLSLSEKDFSIFDNCGGIDLKSARHIVFRFGVTKGNRHSLGVYGIGLKRSIFKIGSSIEFESDDEKKYFLVQIDVNDWKKKPEWQFEFSKITDSKCKPFTHIRIKNLKNDVKREFNSSRFINTLIERTSKTYFKFIKENVDITINKIKVLPYKLEMVFSDEVEPAQRKFSLDGIKVRLVAGAHPDYKNPGWYILCNGRLIISEDRSELTGWGMRGVPNYHTKYNRFKGFAFIDSDDPRKLPWNTAKNGIEKSSEVYAKILPEMQNLTVQYTKYMNKAYPSEKEETIGIAQLGLLTGKPITELTKDQNFKAPPIRKPPEETTIQYHKLKKEVRALKKCLGRINMSNRELGIRTFDYYKEMECPDD